MMFDIRLSAEVMREADNGNAFLGAWGTIQLGDFSERFVAALSAWSPEEYERQWQEAARRLARGEAKSAFVTSFVSPHADEYFEWWKCYRVDQSVYIQNQLRFYDQLPAFFTRDALYDFVEDRKIFSDGSQTSEWQLPLQDFIDFVRKDG
jgi:hypothetical protein